MSADRKGGGRHRYTQRVFPAALLLYAGDRKQNTQLCGEVLEINIWPDGRLAVSQKLIANSQ